MGDDARAPTPEELHDLLEALRSDARAVHEEQGLSGRRLGYIVQATDEFAGHYDAVLNLPGGPERDAILGSGMRIGSELRTRLGLVRQREEETTNVLLQAMPYFATASASAHTMGNSFTMSSPCNGFMPCPFLPSSEHEDYAAKLAQLDTQVGKTYRDAWGAFYSQTDDPGRAGLWQLRQTLDHFFSLLAPDDRVRASQHWIPKEPPDRDQVQRRERIIYAAHQWVADAELRTLMAESAQSTLDAYERLQDAHTRDALNMGKARDTFTAVDQIIRRWVDAIVPWPPHVGA